jgi:mono/diheme cytochrome c family protein
MRPYLTCPAAALALLVGSGLVGNGALAQDVDNGRRIAERSCASCHALHTPAGKASRAIPFPAIAAKPGITADTIASFLLMPHVTMPGLPLTQKDPRDVAAFIMSLKN